MPDRATRPRWQKPKKRFEIDDEVEGLIKAGRLRKDFEGDPYVTARCFLGRAVSLASNKEREQQLSPANDRRDLKKLEDKVRGVAKRLETIAIEAATVLARPIVRGGETLDPANEFARRDLPETALAGLQAFAAGIRAQRKKSRQKSEKVFVSVFVEENIYCWVRLTAGAPGRASQEFASFVDAAHRTLGSAKEPAALGLPFHVEAWDIDGERARNKAINNGQDGWSWQIRKTLRDMAGRPETDRANRYEKGFLPHSVGVQPSAIWRQLKPTIEEFREETRRLNELMLEGVTAAAEILWCEYEIASAETRNRYFLEPLAKRLTISV